MRTVISAFVLSLTLAAPALADDTTPPPPAEAAKAPSKDAADGVVCKRQIKTGTMISVKVCTTAAQRAAQQKGVQSAQEHLQGPNTGVVPN